MKKYFFVFMIVCLFISGCSSSQTHQTDMSTRTVIVISTPEPQPNHTATTLDEKAAILQEIQQAAFAYDRLIEDEKKKGNIIQTQEKDPATGEEIYRYQGDNESQISAMWDETILEISDLNEKYMRLFGGQIKVAPMSLPNPKPTSQEKIEQAVDQSVTEYGHWIADERKNGNTVRVFNFYEMEYANALIGDSYVLSELKSQAVIKYQLALKAPPAEEQALDIKAIHTLESGDITLADTGNLMPFYRADKMLNQYETTHWTYIMDAISHDIIQIAPKDGMTLGNEILLSGETLELKARNFIRMVAPDVNLDSLTPAHGQKEPDFFFRWENRNSSLLDDGHSYPFIQVAIDAQGNFLNYYNTLAFAR